MHARHDSELETLVREAQTQVREAQAIWPTVRADAAEFARYLVSRLPKDRSAAESAVAMSAVAVGDLYLAFACAARDPAALALFEERYLAEVGAFVAHIDRSPAFADEVRQLLRDKLLVGGDEGPAITGYRGRGALGGFVRVAAVRTALNLRRTARRAHAHEAAEDPAEAALSAVPSPELAYLRAQYRDAFAGALREAVADLSDRERAILRLYHAEGLGLEALAALYRVHTSTVSRWLTCARERVADSALRRLREHLRVGASDAGSIAALVMSHLDVSLVRLLHDRG